MADVSQDLRGSLETSITNGISKALDRFGVGNKVSVNAALVLDEVSGRYVPEVVLKFRPEGKVTINGESRDVGVIVDLVMSAGDQRRLAAIRQLAPSFGTAEGETALTERVWTKQIVFPSGRDTVVVYSNKSSSILNGLI